MPHIILEHNFNDQEKINKTCKELLESLSKQETVKIETIKTRSIFVQNVFLGSDGLNRESSFVHINLKLLPGRSDELKTTMSLALQGVLLKNFGTIACSVEVNELKNYSK